MNKVYVNNKLYELLPECTLLQALGVFNIRELNGIALAVNEKVLPRGEWQNQILKDGDKIILIKATQGG